MTEVLNATVSAFLNIWINGQSLTDHYTLSGGTTGSIVNCPSRHTAFFTGFYDDTTSTAVPGFYPAQDLWPATLAPVFSQNGGTIGTHQPRDHQSQCGRRHLLHDQRPRPAYAGQWHTRRGAGRELRYGDPGQPDRRGESARAEWRGVEPADGSDFHGQRDGAVPHHRAELQPAPVRRDRWRRV